MCKLFLSAALGRLTQALGASVQQPQETLQQLCDLFPGFAKCWEEDEEDAPPTDGLVDGVYYEWSHHSVVMSFAPYFWKNIGSFSASQVHAFARWLNVAVAAGGELENALGTCFLEHFPRGPVGKPLWSALSPQAKASARA